MSMLLKIVLLKAYARSEGIEEPLQILIRLWEIDFIIVFVDVAQYNILWTHFKSLNQGCGNSKFLYLSRYK